MANAYLTKHKLNKLGSLSFMGIGEPLDNYDNLLSAIKIINDKKGICLGMRSFTLSTCGLAPMLERVAKDLPQCNLAVSLHAPNNTIRNKLMPVNSAYDIKTLINAIKNYISITKNDVSIQYALMKDINDSEENALELAKLLKGILCHVIIIEYNAVREYNILPSQRIDEFCNTLRKNGIKVTKRAKKGKDIEAACGTMRSKHL